MSNESFVSRYFLGLYRMSLTRPLGENQTRPLGEVQDPWKAGTEETFILFPSW